MVICPSCQTENLPGSFFCADCGSSFLNSKAGGDTTTSIGVEFASGAQANMPVAVIPAMEQNQPVIKVVILNSGRKLSFSSIEPILIGRPDRKREFYPDIDLTSDGGLEAGVSRRHARLLVRDQVWYIEDLRSANGTFVNKQAVEMDSPLRVQDGDEIRLGNILLRLELITILT